MDTVSADCISAYLKVYFDTSKERKYTHQTTFYGEGESYENGYKYMLNFDTPVELGTLPTVTYTELDIHYNSIDNTFKFAYPYCATMSRQSPDETE